MVPTIPSSTQVFDLSSIEPIESQQHDQQDDAPVKKPLNQVDSLPSFDCSTTDENDSESSVSSFSTVGSTSTSGSQRRSMFHRYWKRTGEEPIVLKRTPETSAIREFDLDDSLATVRRSSTSCIDDAAPSAPASSPRRRSSTNSVGSSSSRRRSILPMAPSARRSMPSLNSHPHIEASELRRKSSSSGDLKPNGDFKPTGSCLRESRFSSSGGQPQEGQSPRTPVRFDMEAIDVVHFEPPQERYAEEGWSNFFA